jgi:hypothetical protein
MNDATDNYSTRVRAAGIDVQWRKHGANMPWRRGKDEIARWLEEGKRLISVLESMEDPPHQATVGDYDACIAALHKARQPGELPLNWERVWARAPMWLLRHRHATAHYKQMRLVFYSDQHADKRRKRGEH